MKPEIISENQIVTIGARQLRFDLRTGVLTTDDGKNCTLRAQSAQVLAVLAAHPNQPVSKDDLFDAVWPGLSVTDDSLTQCVADIRKAIGDSKRTTLRTIPKTGYQLVVADATQSAAPPPRLPLRRVAWVGALVLFLLMITGFAALNPLKTSPAKLSAQTDPSIIVLPFEDLSPNGDLGHFADGMTEDLITGLSRWEELQIVNRSTAMSFKGGNLDAREIARRTGSQYILEGSIRRIDDTLRATAQLVDGTTGHNLWADQYDETGDDILAIHDGIIRRIEQSLVGNTDEIRAEEERKSWSQAATTLDEYDYYLRGHSIFYEFTPDAMVRALAIWNEGLARFPNSGHLKIKLGWGRTLCNQMSCAAGPFDFNEIRRILDEGLADPALPPIGYRHGLWLLASQASENFETQTVIATTRELAESFPSDIEGLMRSVNYLTRVGALEEAGRLLELAKPLDLRPMPYFYSEAAYHHYVRGDCTAARPFLDVGGFPEDLLVRAGCFVEFGQLDRARTELQRAEQRFGIRSAKDFPVDLASLPEVRTRLEAQLAKVGWPE